MKPSILTTIALFIAVGTAGAEPTWAPDDWLGESSIDASASDASGYDYQFDIFNAFGSYSSQALTADGSSTTTLDWDASGAHSQFAMDANRGLYEGVTFIVFTALADVDFQMDLQFDVQGSGEGYVEVLMAIQERDGAYHEFHDYRFTPGSVSTSYAGTLVAGQQYWIGMLAHVSGNIVGTGTGSGDVTLSVIPLPTASALAGLGLLGLGVRRRRISL